ncbi:AAA family ATPase [Streptomyces stramineus]
MAASTETRHESSQDLVGRSAELNSVLRRAATARAGTAQAVLVQGPAGIGRSSLLAAAVTRLRADGFTVRTIGGGAAPAGSPTCPPFPAGPCRRNPRDRHPQRPTPTRSAAGCTAASSACWPTARWPSSSTMPRDTTKSSCTAWTSSCEESPRTLFVLLAQRTESDGPGNAVLAELLAQDRCTLLELGPMSEPGTGRMIDRALGGPVDPHFARRCAQICGGNPCCSGGCSPGCARPGSAPTAAACAGCTRSTAAYSPR